MPRFGLSAWSPVALEASPETNAKPAVSLFYILLFLALREPILWGLSWPFSVSESQHKEVAELLTLEGLASIVHSSPSEQVAYLLVERSSLLERMEALEQELGAPHCLGRPCVASLQDEWHLFHPRIEEGFHQLQQSLHHIQGMVSKGKKKRNVENNVKEKSPDLVWEEAERGLDGAPGRLRSAQDGIPALEEDLDAAEGERGKLRDPAGAEIGQGSLGKEEERAEQPAEPLAKPSLPGEPFSALDPDSGTGRMGELEKPLQAKQAEEAPFLEEGILAVQRQLSAHREGHGAVAQPCPPRPALGSAGGDTEQGPPHKGAPQPPQEEPPGPLWGPQQAPSTIQKQLRLEQETTLELRLQNLQLQQEKLKVQAELRQAQGKRLAASRAPQGELSQQQAKELQLQRLQLSQAAQQQSHLREQLSQESQRAAQAEKRVEELERRLQLSESQAALGRRQLEEEAREARAKEAEARQELLEQQREEQQQQQRRLWREKEAQLLRALAERQAQAQQQEGKLRALEDERRVLAKEQLRCQGQSQSLSEQLSALQQQKEALCEEQRQVLKQVDVSLRKHSERRLRHKARLRQAKERLLGEVKLRDSRIRHLENEVRLCKSQAERDQLLIRRVTSENESLFRERRKSLEQLHSLEEAKQSHGQALCTLQSRVQLLEGENRQLQDRALQLSLQVGILERTLRTIHVHSLQELKSLGFPDCPLQRKLLPFPGFSFLVTRLSDPGGLCQAIKDGQRVEPGQKALLSPLAFQSTGIGCVDVPRNLPDFHEGEPGHPVG
ncbi:hypothetical protein E2320_006362 [Naja naja]|nr:hypothetical protein E2320_006362 [Naja naja]